jgi:hypothetical protein
VKVGLGKWMIPLNIFPLLFAAEQGLRKLAFVPEPWGDISKEMILSARKIIDGILYRGSEACFNSEEWMELMEADGVSFRDVNGRWLLFYGVLKMPLLLCYIRFIFLSFFFS